MKFWLPLNSSLPEEVTEGRKIALSEDQLRERTLELLDKNGTQVVKLLIDYAQSSGDARKNPQLEALGCAAPLRGCNVFAVKCECVSSS